MGFILILYFLFGWNQPRIVFQDATKDSGISDSIRGMMGHGAAWGDFDNDGRPDLFVGGFCDRPDSEYTPAKGPVPTRLFHNLGNGRFEVVKNSSVEFFGRTSGAIFVDLNDDGFPELYVSNNSIGETKQTDEPQASAQKLQSRLFLNDGGSFRDVSNESGASPKNLLTARNIGVFDYNGDGLLDLLIVEDRFRPDKRPRSVLLKNTGNLKFKIANTEAGIPNDIYGFGIAVADLNDDDRPDFFIPHENRMFLSQPGNKYREAVELKKVFHWTPLDGEDWPSGAAFGDLNLDGNLDMVLTIHHEPARNRVFLNKGIKKGIPLFEDVTDKVGLAQSVPIKCPHVEIQDFDNDGLPDIYTTAAWKERDSVIPLIYRNERIGNNGLPHFAPLREIKSPMIYFPAGPTADFNEDGRLDIFLVNWFRNESSHLLKNQTKGGNWLQVEAPIGSKIKLFSNDKLVGYQQLFPGFGYASGQLPVCHFGVGNLESVNLEVRLPDGVVKRRDHVQVNARVEFNEK